jgi:hypothetical protein
MTADEIRILENSCIARSLADPLFDDADVLGFLASLIDGHDYLRSKLMQEPDRRKRRGKLDAMRPYLKFRALSCDAYELAEAAKSCGVQPIYQEQEDVKRIVMPYSHMHEVRNV